MRTSILSTLALGACTAFAQNVTNCVTGGVCYAVNIPAVSASGSSGDIFIHVTGPSSLSWIGIGQGSGMSGANIFMIYANAAGNNVTVSPRLGTGQRQPSTNGAASQVTLLEGSGIADGEMTANFRCANCNTWTGGSMDFTSSSTNWIWAYRSGQAIQSNDLSANLQEHSQYGMMEFNLQSATGGNSVNPFATAAASGNPTSGTTTGSGSTSGTGSGSSSGSVVSSGPSARSRMILIAHGVLMPVAFVIMYPLGAMIIRLLSFKGAVWVHAGWMIFTYMVVLAGMGLGINIAMNLDLIDSYHAIIGLVVVGCLILQPITGLLHHRIYKQKGAPNGATPVHIWWGRAIITLGIINGGLGLKLAANTKNGEIVYGVVAGVMWVAWMAVVVVAAKKKVKHVEGSMRTGSDEKMNQHVSRYTDDGVRPS